MCDLPSLWPFQPFPWRCRPRCSLLLSCTSSGEVPPTGHAPAQHDIQDGTAVEEFLGVSPKKAQVEREGLRSRPHAWRMSLDEPCPEPPTRWRTAEEIEALLRVEDDPFPSPPRKAALADAPLLAVDGETKVPHTACQPQVQARRRRAFRRRSVPLRRSRRSRVQPAEESMPADHQPSDAAHVAEAYGHGMYRPCWDWPLSRLEKKMRLLELDRELMKADRDELENLLLEARCNASEKRRTGALLGS
mmetsp:Transcript_42915/g.99979  ORF Transcript_42915/g.99979 Transcript_42915/m.99979 type:complete len:247 (+) Transcript_42915:39-779(+)